MLHVHSPVQLRTGCFSKVTSLPTCIQRTRTTRIDFFFFFQLLKHKYWQIFNDNHWVWLNFNTFYRLFHILVDVTIKYSLLRWRLTNDIDVLISFFLHFYFFKGLRRRQAVLQHSEHQKQLWIIRVQLSWPFAEALETWSSGTSLWVDQDACRQHLSQERRALYQPLCRCTDARVGERLLELRKRNRDIFAVFPSFRIWPAFICWHEKGVNDTKDIS